jgi:hypothetical protein
MRTYTIRGGKEGKERLNILARAMPMKNPSGVHAIETLRIVQPWIPSFLM